MYKKIWYLICRYILVVLNNNTFDRLIFRINCLRLGHKYYSPNYINPKTFSEKIVYLKNQHENGIGSILADKVLVREYVSDKIGGKYLINLIGVYEKADVIKFENLPTQFVIKTNHGSGWNILVSNKANINWAAIKEKVNYWLSLNAWYLNREWQYRNMQPLILIEELLGSNIHDYKVFCFNGIPTFIQVDIDRFIKHTRSFYNVKWEKQSFGINYPISETEIPKPESLDEMFMLASKLSAELKFARVDFYIQNNKIYFGEITLHPGAGVEPFLSYDQDLMLGQYITI